ncbi:NAD(P)-binding protein [Daedalea quercina L-15889]|uniref:NAD(P)-binding protein n=1 Tax=Daedalea quercina L-15889 TaxID=1314783 RepID=A0A165M0F2_9APHY|nr:NAD(P)-binding protein [Daedalea quercina L-15889]
MDLKLDGVHVLITGSSGGIGVPTTELFLKAGAKVTAHYNRSSASLQPILDAHGPSRVRASQANLVNEEDVSRLYREATSALGAVQVLVVNHGGHPMEDVSVAETSLEQWKNTFDINMTSSFLVVREYLKQLVRATDKERESASVVIIGSTAGKYGERGHADYAAAKSAMMYGFTMSLKNEIVRVAPRGRVNSVAPGWTRTHASAPRLAHPEVAYRALATIPLRKVATPEDIASQVVFVSSNAVSGHVSGQVIMVDGGMEGRLLNTPEDTTS